MKKILSLFLAFVLVLFALTACAEDPSDNTSNAGQNDGTDSNTAATVRLGGMTGPTSIGMAKLLSDNRAGSTKNKYEFTLAGAGAEIKTKLQTGELDIAAIPANLAANLYMATGGEIRILAVNTLGVVSLLEKGDTVSSLADLRGKTVYAPASAKGAIPEIVFTYLLGEAGLTVGTDVQIEWVPTVAGSTGNPLAPKLKSGEIVLSPEPAATALLSAVEGARRAVSLDEAWKSVDNGSEYITGVTVVRTAFAEAHPEAVAHFLAEYEASITYANTNAAETATLVNEFGILSQSAALIEAAIPSCHIAFLSGAEMKEALGTYFSLLVPVMPSAFGGEVPSDAIYYIK